MYTVTIKCHKELMTKNSVCLLKNLAIFFCVMRNLQKNLSIIRQPPQLLDKCFPFCTFLAKTFRPLYFHQF